MKKRANAFQNLERADIILIGEFKYLVCDIKKDIITLLPVNLDSVILPDLIPKMYVKFQDLKDYIKMNKYETYCLMNQNNIVIQNVLLKYFNG